VGERGVRLLPQDEDSPNEDAIAVTESALLERREASQMWGLSDSRAMRHWSPSVVVSWARQNAAHRRYDVSAISAH